MVAMNVWPTDAADGSVANEARWRKMGRHFAQTGVAGGVGLEMKPTLSGTNLTVRNGACWVDGHYCELLADQVLTSTANGIAVVRFDPAANTAELLWRDGITVPAQSPTGTYEMLVASVAASALTDRRRMQFAENTAPLLEMNATRAVPIGTNLWSVTGFLDSEEVVDTHAMHDQFGAEGTGGLVVPYTGYYDLYYGLVWDGASIAGPSIRNTAISVKFAGSGTDTFIYGVGDTAMVPPSVAVQCWMTLRAQLVLPVASVLKVQVYQGSGVTINMHDQRLILRWLRSNPT
jgi:hypothetical protein